eukprot:TRINITY_DN26674_c0_g1_i1.p1 TRINITY_DN26674_c0_g1~~TRINITY_DN26674_c0_g1_i1.p1  ORF type:complete len:219 (+),score=17.72 TRINITY_DN26674_c0_g1_i1:81-737(+)
MKVPTFEEVVNFLNEEPEADQGPAAAAATGPDDDDDAASDAPNVDCDGKALTPIELAQVAALCEEAPAAADLSTRPTRGTGDNGKMYALNEAGGWWAQRYTMDREFTATKANAYYGLLKSNPHANVVAPILFQADGAYYYTVFPACEPYSGVPKAARDGLLAGLQHIHVLGLSHGDIKKENVLKYNDKYAWIDFDRGVRQTEPDQKADLVQFAWDFPS